MNLKACLHLHTDPHRIRIQSTSILSALESTSKRSRSDRDPPHPHQEVDSIRIRSRLARQKRIHLWVCRNITWQASATTQRTTWSGEQRGAEDNVEWRTTRSARANYLACQQPLYGPKKRRRLWWGVWGAEDVQSQLDGVARNKAIFEKFASSLANHGHHRTSQQCTLYK